jgi:hypothetical protein
MKNLRKRRIDRQSIRSINIPIVQNSFSDSAIETVTRAINDGITGLPERIAQTNRIRPILTGFVAQSWPPGLITLTHD